MTHVVLITNDVVGRRMAGPGIRFWEFARVLSRQFRVTLAIPPFLDLQEQPREPDFAAQIRICRRITELRSVVGEADVVVTLGAVVSVYPFLSTLKKPLVVDSYDPFMLAGLHQNRDAARDERVAAHERYRKAHLIALHSADLVLCASEKQRDYWLGMLSAVGRINPYTHDQDSSFRHLVRVVPFGLPRERPRHTAPALKGIVPGIGRDDKVVLWGGGIWNWLDAPTAVKAMARIAEQRSDVKLFFMGTRRPNLGLSRMAAVEQTIALSERLGLKDKYVFFHDWVDYEHRQNYLLEADVGMMLHRDLLETRFAFRTRFLDYVWAGLPIVATEGDVLSEHVRHSELGRVVAPGDEAAVARAILELLETPNLKEACQSRFAALAQAYQWDVVTEPLVDFCRDPSRAPDKRYLRTLRLTCAPSPWELRMKAAWAMFKDSGLGRLAIKR